MSRQLPEGVIEARHLLQSAQTQLQEAGIADAALDARLLLALALGRWELKLAHSHLAALN